MTVSFSPSADGWVSFEEFNAALVRLNFVGTLRRVFARQLYPTQPLTRPYCPSLLPSPGVQAEVRALFDRYDADGSGLLSYEEFSSGLFGLIPNLKGDPESRSAVERVRRKIAERGGLNGIRTLGRIMRTMDDSGDRRLDREELKWGLKDYGVDLSERELNTVISAFDRNGDGIINFDEFLRGIRGSLNARRRAMILLAYDVLDRDGSGMVDIEDVKMAYDATEHPEVKAGKLTEEDALKEFMSQWDTTEKDGKVTKDEFLDYYKDVSASIDDDDYFELVIRNAWHISGGEGWAESAFLLLLLFGGDGRAVAHVVSVAVPFYLFYVPAHLLSADTANRRVLVTFDSGEQEVIEIKDDLGLDASDVDGMRARLEAQGVEGIAKIETTF